jgi:DNA polymerase-1|tara:strand:+ start:2202 stop:4160 length:1959 start_codon:yes stop_codon:yes gene_type:complete
MLSTLSKEWLQEFNVYVTHAIKCRQAEGTIKIASIRECNTYLVEDIEKIKPDAVVTFGDTAKKAMQEYSGKFPLNIQVHNAPPIVVDNQTTVTEVLNRVWHELHNVLLPIPLTTNLSRVLLQAARTKLIALDFEWNPDTGIAHSVGLAAGTVAGGFVLDSHTEKAIENILVDKSMTIVGHNIAEDVRRVIDKFGARIRCQFIDTLLLKRELVFNLRQGGLKYFAERYLLLENYWKEITVEDFASPTPKLLKYTGGDAWATLSLYNKFKQDFKNEWNHMEYARAIDMEMILPVAYMVHGGIKIDKKKLKKQLSSLKLKENKLLSEFETTHKINPASPAQVLQLLKKRKHKIKSTGIDALSKLNDEVVDKLIEYRKLSKLTTTYLDKLGDMTDDNDLVHCNLHLANTITGRMSSSNPNMQNIPPDVRPIFASVFGNDGNLVTVDASQSELRCLAYLSGSKYLIDAYNEGTDMHTLVSQLAGISRKNAKVLNFAFVYGSSEFGLKNQLVKAGVDMSKADNVVQSFISTMDKLGIREYQQKLLDKAKKLHYIYSPYGRVGTRLNPTQVVNFPIQSFSADLNKMRIIYVFNRLREEKLVSRIWLEFHDAMELDIYKPEQDKVYKIVEELDLTIPDVLNKGIEIQLPLDVKENGVNWQ